MNILVIGATGQLGYKICEKLQSSDHQVHALHRKSSDTSAFQELKKLHPIEGDLLDVASLKTAVQGKDVVISTANSAVPSQKRDNFKNDVRGHKNLLKVCKDALVKQFIFTSVIPMGELDQKIPISRSKKNIEETIKNSGIPFTIFQPAAFMDIYFAFTGSELPLKNEKVLSLNRPFKFMQNFYRGIRKDIEQKNRFNVIGKGDVPTSLIALENVADFHVSAVGNPEATNQIIQIGGPEALSGQDIKELFEKVLDKKLKVKSTSPGMMNVLSKVMSLFNINASNILALNYASTKQPSIVENAVETAEKFGVKLITAEEYLRSKT